MHSIRSIGVMCLVLSMLGGCVRYERAALEDGARFEHVWARDLSAFEARLAAENQTGIDDVWTRVGEAWIALANCRPVDRGAMAELPADETAHVARLVHASLVLEDIRRQRLLYWRGADLRSTSISSTLFASLDDVDFFDRLPGDREMGRDIIWPDVGEEAWADELPGPVPQPHQCQELYAEIFARAQKERALYDEEVTAVWRATTRRRDDLGAPRRGPSSHTYARHLLLGEEGEIDEQDESGEESLADMERDEIEAARRVVALYDALDPSLKSAPSLSALAWRAQSHEVYLIGQILSDVSTQPDLTSRETEMLEGLTMEHERAILALFEREGATPLSPDIETWRRAHALVSAAALFAREGRPTNTLAALSRAREMGLRRDEIASFASYLEAYALDKTQKWGELGALTRASVSPPSPYYTPYVWRVARGLRQSGNTDRFLQWAMESFRDRPYRADPFMRALYVETLELLVSYPFEPRILELLEDMGPRDTTYERVEAYASVALDRGEAPNAAAAARWLLSGHRNATYWPRYWAILALAAFLEDDTSSFEEYLDQIVARPEGLDGAIAQSRRATFYASADAQLATVFRRMLPVMAEWGSASSAIKMRQKWLRIVIDRAQQFVRQTKESLTRPALIELYRLASSMLDDAEARAYPEQVGRLEPVPLVLGTVRVAAKDLEPYEPKWRIPSSPFFSLTLVPRDALPPTQWPMWWGEDKTTERGLSRARGEKR